MSLVFVFASTTVTFEQPFIQAELMLQLDGSVGNPCTCFMFMKPTEMVKELLVKWIQSIVDAEAWYEDQVGFVAGVPERETRPTRESIARLGRAAINVYPYLQ